MKMKVRPIRPNNLKLTQVSVSNEKATYRLSAPSTMKNSAHARFSFVHTVEGSTMLAPIMRSMTGFSPMNREPIKTMANSQLMAVGFHFMNTSSCKKSVSPPNRATRISVMRWAFSNLPLMMRWPKVWIAQATIRTAVAV